jgi:hypothetical protein
VKNFGEKTVRTKWGNKYNASIQLKKKKRILLKLGSRAYNQVCGRPCVINETENLLKPQII